MSSLAVRIFVQTLQRAVLLWGFLSAPGKGFLWVWARVLPGVCPPAHVPCPFAIALVLLSACDTHCIQKVECYPVVPLVLKF